MHKHKEAFCLMTYKCEKCGKVEIVYNSRDGVTPFIIDCDVDNCDGQMMHIDWHNDIYNPVFEIKEGMRYFVNITKEEYKAEITKQIERGVFDKQLAKTSLENVIGSLFNDWYEGMPRVVKAGKL